MKYPIEGVQRLFTALGEAGCHIICQWLTAQQIIKQPINLIEVFQGAIDRALIYYNAKNHNDPKNCLVLNSASLMSYLTGLPIKYRYVSGEYQPGSGEFAYYEWAWSHMVNGKSTETIHFCLSDYDPLGDSLTRANGKIKSTRVFRIKA